MFPRKLMLPAALATAAGAPYLVFEGDLPATAQATLAKFWPRADNSAAAPSIPAEFSAWTQLTPTPLAAVPALTSGDSMVANLPMATDPRLTAPIAGPPVGQLGEIIRFDITPGWVTGRWPRVTSTLSETGLEGLRVPVVTGTQIHDLAGSLTYFFDHQHQVQRVTCEGFTGDPRPLIDLVTKYYGLQPEPTLDAALYVQRWNGRPTSVLRVLRAPVMDARSPHSQLQVQLELNRPGPSFSVSPQFQMLIDHDRNIRRW
jgi:hypothetical protein